MLRNRLTEGVCSQVCMSGKHMHKGVLQPIVLFTKLFTFFLIRNQLHGCNRWWEKMSLSLM